MFLVIILVPDEVTPKDDLRPNGPGRIIVLSRRLMQAMGTCI